MLGACSDSASDDTDGGTVDLPDLPAAEPPLLCHVEMTCAEEIIDDPKKPCQIKIMDGDNQVEYDGMVGVELRGRSSRDFPKPQYGIELWADNSGNTKLSESLFGMGGDPDWILNGAYVDRSFIRNKLLFDMYQGLGGNERYTVENVYCDLSFNDDPRGIYILSEKIKVDDDRLDLALDDTQTGQSFLLKQGDQFSSKQGIKPVGVANGDWILVSPKQDEATAAEIQGISTFLDAFNETVQNPNSQSSVFDFLDLSSAVDFYLLEEFAKNVDAYHLSMHIWKEPGGKIHFIPWDFDLAFGQPEYSEGFLSEGLSVTSSALIQHLRANDEFRGALASRWQELRQGTWSQENIFKRIDFYLETIGPFVDSNFERWPIEDIVFLNDPDNLYPITDHADEITKIKTWIEARLNWLDSEF